MKLGMGRNEVVGDTKMTTERRMDWLGAEGWNHGLMRMSDQSYAHAVAVGGWVAGDGGSEESIAS